MNATDLMKRTSYAPMPHHGVTVTGPSAYENDHRSYYDGTGSERSLDDEKTKRDQLRVRITECRFDRAKPPPEPIPRFLIHGNSVCTPGNLTAIIAQTKSGKTAAVGAAIAAAIAAHHGITTADTLGWTATAPGRKRLIHIDTEQSPFDHHVCLLRELRRVGVDTVPDWLHSYCLTGFSPVELKVAIKLLLEDAEEDGVFAVIIDGIGDLVCSVNDLPECVAIVSELRTLSIAQDCPILCVIHDNEGRQTNGDGRGHLGKELMRKAESNLRLKKTDEITVLFSEKQRKAPIMEKDGPRFSYDKAAGMHLSCTSLAKEKDDDLRERLKDQAEAVFAEIGTESAPWGEMIAAISKIRRVKKSTAEDRWTLMKKHGVIRNAGGGLWAINPVTP